MPQVLRAKIIDAFYHTRFAGVVFIMSVETHPAGIEMAYYVHQCEERDAKAHARAFMKGFNSVRDE